MKHQISDNLFIRAENLLDNAGQELQRAEEDVVVPAVCYNSRETIYNYLEGYLIRNMQAPKEPVSLENLKNQCANINPEFKELDFSSLDCSHDNKAGQEAYCMSVTKVKSCFQVAQEVKDLIMRSEL
jgi:hypothetical protein